MAYEISFTKSLKFGDTDQYINECCYGGDIVSDVLLPTIRKNYSSIKAFQEDWGWLIVFKSKKISMEIDIHCDYPKTGSFKVLLFANQKRFLKAAVEDKVELDKLRDYVVGVLEEWTGSSINIELFVSSAH